MFVRVTDDQFEKEFADKIVFSRDPNEQSPSMLSVKKQRISSMANNSGKKDEPQPGPLIIQSSTASV